LLARQIGGPVAQDLRQSDRWQVAGFNRHFAAYPAPMKQAIAHIVEMLPPKYWGLPSEFTYQLFVTAISQFYGPSKVQNSISFPVCCAATT